MNEVRDQYPEGLDKALAAVEEGSVRGAAELGAELAAAFAELEAAWDRVDPEHWTRLGVCVPGPRTMADIVSRHLRDVEVHNVDLCVGFSPADWSDLFVEIELPKRLADLPKRADRAELLAWLLGRTEAPTLGPW